MTKALLAAALLTVGAAEPEAQLRVEWSELRNRDGVVMVCLMSDAAAFPKCEKDRGRVMRRVPAGTGAVEFAVPPGTYAITAFHDENGNGRLDTLLGIPREGFAFSRNPVVRFGAPRFSMVRIDLASGFTRQTLRMQYLL